MSYTLEDIAKMAGVSRGTVSRVVNGQPGVKEEVRKKVMRIIEETGYYPNAQARSLAGGKTENIGVVVFGNNPVYLSHHIFYEVVQGIQGTMVTHSYDLLLYSNRNEKDRHYWKKIADRRKVDGLIIMGEYIQPEYLEYYHERGIPFVLVGKKNMQRIPLFCVTSNYRQGAYTAAKHLIGLGCGRIAFIRGITNTYHDNERFAGFSQAMQEAGLPVRSELVVVGNADKTQAYHEIKRLIEQGHRMDAVFACNDLMAFGAIEALNEHGFEVPYDTAVTGYDDITSAQFYSPPITTVRQDKLKLGYEAAELLIKLIKGQIDGKKPVDIIVDNDLVIRKSSLYGQPRRN